MSNKCSIDNDEVVLDPAVRGILDLTSGPGLSDILISDPPVHPKHRFVREAKQHNEELYEHVTA